MLLASVALLAVVAPATAGAQSAGPVESWCESDYPVERCTDTATTPAGTATRTCEYYGDLYGSASTCTYAWNGRTLLTCSSSSGGRSANAGSDSCQRSGKWVGGGYSCHSGAYPQPGPFTVYRYNCAAHGTVLGSKAECAWVYISTRESPRKGGCPVVVP